MRERIAVAISVGATTMLVALALLFARVQAPTAQPLQGTTQSAAQQDAAAAVLLGTTDAPQGATGASPHVAADSTQGRTVFVAQGCERCHSVQGRGSPRVPLDGVGARRTLSELRDWTLATPEVQDSMSGSVVRSKQRYVQIPDPDMNALLHYMSLLQEPRSGRN